MNFNKLKKTNYHQKIIILCIGFVIFISLFFYFILNKKMQNITKHKNNIIQQKNNIEIQITKEKNKSKLSAQIKEIEPKIKKMDFIFINKNKKLEFITTLENIAQQNNVIQKIFLNNNTITSDTIYQETPVNLVISGEFNNLIKYLTELEKINYSFNIKTISFSNPMNKENILDLNISANTYWK